MGLADGAKENWIYLEPDDRGAGRRLLPRDEYLWTAAEALFADDGAGLRPWVDAWCHRLKHEPGAAAALIADLEARARRWARSGCRRRWSRR